jgi:phosphomannomutase/phosphomannomutase/phosphoglucomutase
MNLAAFKAYDIRGRIPVELNEELAYDIGRAYAAFVKPRCIAVGRDIRLTSAALAAALQRGLLDSGCDVRDIGLCGTEGVYFATFAYELDGGIMVTASHNPPDYNGMKLVREDSRPISADTGLADMRAFIEAGAYPPPALLRGSALALDTGPKYLEHLLSYVDRARLRRLKVVVNAGNGGAAHPGWDISERHPQSDARGEPGGDGRGGAQRRRGCRACLGRGLRPLLLLRCRGALHRRLLSRGPPRGGLPRARARRTHRA